MPHHLGDDGIGDVASLVQVLGPLNPAKQLEHLPVVGGEHVDDVRAAGVDESHCAFSVAGLPIGVSTLWTGLPTVQRPHRERRMLRCIRFSLASTPRLRRARP